MTLRRLIVPTVLILGLAPAVVSAQNQRPMTIVDVITVPQLSDPQLSADGKQILYELAEADWEGNRRVTHIWRVNADGSGTIQLTNGKDGESSPRWAPDGKTVAFLAKRGDDKATEIYLMPLDGGEARRLTNHTTGVSNITWIPDGSALLFVASEDKTQDQKDKEKAKDDVYAFEENYQQRHLWKVTVGDGVEQRMTQGDFSIRNYDLSSDGTKIVFSRAPAPILEVGDQSEVWIMNADGTGGIQLTNNGVSEGGGTLSPDGTQVLVQASANAKWEKYYNSNLFLIPATGGSARELVPDVGYAIGRAGWSKDGKSIFFVAGMGVHSELFELDLASGKPRQLTDGQHSIDSWALSPETNQHVMTIDEPTNPGDIWLMPASGQAQPTRVTHVFDYLARDFNLPRQEKVTWKGADNVEVEGVVYYPLDYQPGQKYPLVVQTHGGPQSADQFGFPSWSTYPQVLTAMGYVVLKPNYRGSTGYGDTFLRDMVGHYFQNAHLDVMAGVDHLIRLGIADGDRMAKMGWSAGGHMTNKIITFTTRFKAASSGAGAANWVSMYAQSDTRSQRTPWFGGTPWQKNAPIDLYWDNSPLKYVANVTTPTIFLVGGEDERVPSPQSVEMYRALKSNGVPTHLYMAPREPHGWRELRHELFKVNVELDWFEKYVTKRSYTWEKAPESKSKDASK